MKVLVVYAHHNPRSFTRAVLEQVTKGLEDGGHSCTVNDLNAIGFDPIFRPRMASSSPTSRSPWTVGGDEPRGGCARDGGGPDSPLDGETLAA